MLYPEFPVIGFLSAVLVLVPLPRQIRAGNIACIALILWFFEHCHVVAINSIIWAGNVNNVASVWCDITSSLRNGTLIALSAATLCICKHIEFISSGRPVTSDSNRRRGRILELVMCFGVPVLWVLLFYCFQMIRFFIHEYFGCTSGTLNNNGLTALLFGPPLLLAIMSVIYGCVALFHLFKYHQTNAKFLSLHLKSRDAGISRQQYFRLMVMGMLGGIWGVVWISLDISFIATRSSYPIPSWNDIHKADSTIIEVPTVLLGSENIRQFYLIWWGFPGGAILFFLLFGTSYDSLYEYVKFWTWLWTTVLRQPLREKTVSTLRSRSAPIYRIDITDDLKSKLPTPLDRAFGSPVLPPKD